MYLGIPFVRRAFTFNILVQLSRAYLGYCQKQNDLEKRKNLTRNLIKQIKSYTSNTYMQAEKKANRSKKNAMSTSTATARKMKETREEKLRIECCPYYEKSSALHR